MSAEPFPYVLNLDDQGMIIALTVQWVSAVSTVALPRKSQLCWLLARNLVFCNSI